MRRIKLTIAYDGTNYCGFQLQPELPTIEGELNRALSELTHKTITVIGASRTDSGVHAYGNVAVFDTESSIPAEKFPFALISFLPPDIRVVGGEEVSPDWHPRKCDCIKTYEYVYSCGSIEDPKLRLYASCTRHTPDIDKMRQAAEYLIGEHDFTSFANPSSQLLREGGSAVRTIYAIDIFSDAAGGMEPGARAGTDRVSEVTQARSTPDAHTGASIGSNIRGDSGLSQCRTRLQRDEYRTQLNTTVTIRISGNGFLYNMVRIIAGTLMNVGTGLWTPDRVREALKAHDRTKAGPTAEARGLTLTKIEYL